MARAVDTWLVALTTLGLHCALTGCLSPASPLPAAAPLGDVIVEGDVGTVARLPPDTLGIDIGLADGSRASGPDAGDGEPTASPVDGDSDADLAETDGADALDLEGASASDDPQAEVAEDFTDNGVADLVDADDGPVPDLVMSDTSGAADNADGSAADQANVGEEAGSFADAVADEQATLQDAVIELDENALADGAVDGGQAAESAGDAGATGDGAADQAADLGGAESNVGQDSALLDMVDAWEAVGAASQPDANDVTDAQPDTGDVAASADVVDTAAAIWALGLPLATVCTPTGCASNDGCNVSSCNPVTGVCSKYLDPWGQTPSCQQDLSPCVASSPGCACDKTNYVCLQCLTDSDCGGMKACIDNVCTGSGTCFSGPFSCPKGTLCNSKTKLCVQCLASSDCAPGSVCHKGGCVPACTSDNDCEGACLLSAGACVECQKNSHCWGGSFCNGTTCTVPRCGVGKCGTVGGKVAYFKCKADHTGYDPPVVCPSPSACVTADCDPLLGCSTVLNKQPCDDGDKCTVLDNCLAGSCVGQSGCNDGNSCTADSCTSAAAGCKHTPLPDAFACQDNNVCTTDACVAGNCVSLPLDATSCADGSPCKAKWQCESGTCKGPIDLQANCDDGDECTKDSCGDKGACVHKLDAGAACNTSNPCGKSTCGYYGCAVAMALKATCTDGDACTTDSCVNGTCVSYSPPSMFWMASDSEYLAVTGLPDGAWLRLSKAFDNNQFSVERADANGKLQWSTTPSWYAKKYKYLTIADVEAAGDQGFVAVGWVQSTLVTSPYLQRDGYLIRMTQAGPTPVVQWEHALNQGKDAQLRAVARAGDVVYAVGDYSPPSGPSANPWAVGVNVDGKPMWQQAPDTLEGGIFVDVTATTESVAAVGLHAVANKPTTCWLVRFSPSGKFLSSHHYFGQGFAHCKAVAAVPGGWVLVGFTHPGGSAKVAKSAWMLRVDTAGQPIQELTWDGTVEGTELFGVARVPDGSVVAVGEAAGGNTLIARANAAGDKLLTSTMGAKGDKAVAVAGGPNGAWAVGQGVALSFGKVEGFAWQFQIDGKGATMCGVVK